MADENTSVKRGRGREKGTVGIYGGIGDYIHYSYLNYLAYGTYRGKNKQSSNSIYQAISESRKKLDNIRQSTFVQGSLQDIADYYTDFLFGENNLSNIIAKYNKHENLTEYEKALVKFINEKLASGYIVSSDLSADIYTKDQGKIEGQIAHWKKAAQQKKVYMSTIKKRIKDLEVAIAERNRILSDGQLTDDKRANIESTKKRLEEIEKEFFTISQWAEVVGETVSLMKKNKNGYSPTKMAKGSIKLMDLLEEAAALTKKIDESTLNSQTGNVGEIAVAEAMAVFKYQRDLTLTELEQEITGNKYLLGGSRYSSTTDLQMSTLVSTKTLMQTGSFTKKKKFNGDVISLAEGEEYLGIRASQDTVDIQMELEDTNNIFGTNLFTASVKNYSSFNNGISIVSSTSLLAILNLLGYKFANHYLNLVVQHSATIGSFIEADLSIPDEAQDLLTYALAVRGLSGARNENFSKLSKYFVAINRNQKEVYVCTTYELLKNIENNPPVYIDANIPPYGGILANDWADTPETRITNVIIEAQKMKLTASLKQSAVRFLTKGHAN